MSSHATLFRSCRFTPPPSRGRLSGRPKLYTAQKAAKMQCDLTRTMTTSISVTHARNAWLYEVAHVDIRDVNSKRNGVKLKSIVLRLSWPMSTLAKQMLHAAWRQT